MWIHADDSADVLSRVLARLKLDAFAIGAFDAGGSWAITFPPADALRFKAIHLGQCWLAVEGESEPVRLRAGDCFLVARGRGFTLSRERSPRRRTPIERLVRDHRGPGAVVCGGGGEVFSTGTVFQFEGHFAPLVFQSMPAVIHIPGQLDQAAVLRWSLDRFVTEWQGEQAGRALMLGQLATVILLQTLRIYPSTQGAQHSWMTALSHPRLGKALQAIHRDYGKRLTLESLAAIGGMSRAGFASSFRQWVGVAPIDYLTRWRMQMACDLLQQGRQGVATIADQVGYDSESAFSAAFKKTLGVRPGFYQRHGLAHDRPEPAGRTHQAAVGVAGT